MVLPIPKIRSLCNEYLVFNLFFFLTQNKVLWPGTLEMVKNAQEDSSNHLCLMPFDCFNESSTKSKVSLNFLLNMKDILGGNKVVS